MPIPTSILSLIAAAVDAMAPSAYFFAYGPVDVVDPAAWPVGSPQVMLEQSGWNPSSSQRQMVGKITQAMLLTFHVYVPKGAGDIDAEMSKVDTDIKRMMQANDDALRAAGLFIGEYQGTRTNYRLVEAYPGEMRISFSLTWRQSRVNPEST